MKFAKKKKNNLKSMKQPNKRKPQSVFFQELKQLSERKIQNAFFKAFNKCGFHNYALPFAVKNEVGKNCERTGRLNKLAGVVSGMADVIVLDMRGKCMPLFLEFKASKGNQSINQKHMQAILEEAGYTYYIVRSSEEAINRVKEYFNL
jgi:hypothetical protein